jgi:hypothetical protein
MTECPHEIWERESDVTADGSCPICLRAECERLKEELRAVLKHVEDLRAERHSTKQMLEDVLKKYGLGSKTPHYGLGRGGTKTIE